MQLALAGRPIKASAYDSSGLAKSKKGEEDSGNKQDRQRDSNREQRKWKKSIWSVKSAMK